ncbi:tail fiber assembly protein, partial [Salmonella enterica subsp. enterica serovar Montevideo]|nr:tail fiber assembly protein [Salmonella enterica subsp. enterica serovar Montevideo]
AENQACFRLIRQHTVTPIAVGEVFNSIWDCKQLIEEQLIDYIVPVDYQAKAETTRQKLLNDADNAIKDWRTELTLGIISDENKA